MRIKFDEAAVVDDFRKGTPQEERYEKGRSYTMSDSAARHWMSRNKARPASDPLDHDDNGAAGGSMPADPGEQAMTPAALLAAINADQPMAFFPFKAEAEKILGDATPAKKVDIIAALEALAAEA